MIPRWLQMAEQPTRRNSTLATTNSTSSAPTSSFDHPSATMSETPALRKRLSLYARKRASSAWLPARDAEDIAVTRTASDTPALELSSWSSDPPEQSGFRQSLRRTSRIVTAPALTNEHITRWIRGTEKPTSETTQDSMKARRNTIAISSPFNFEHVSHSRAHQLPKLASVGSDSLIDEIMSAVDKPPKESTQGAVTGARSTAIVAEPPRPVSRARSSSLASVLSQHRSTPTMVHPALRSDGEQSGPELSAQAWLAPLIHRNSGSPSLKNLEVVPEEQEPESPTRAQAKLSTVAQGGKDVQSQCPNASAKSFLRVSITSEDNSKDRKSSVPSLCSADSWEEDVDYCYSVEAESNCNFEWSHARLSGPSPRDSLFRSPSARNAGLSDDQDVESPRASIARQQHKRTTRADSANALWQSAEAFRNPRKAPETPMPESRSSCDGSASIASSRQSMRRLSSAMSTSPFTHAADTRKPRSQAWSHAVPSKWRSPSRSVTEMTAVNDPPSGSLPLTPNVRAEPGKHSNRSFWIR